MKKTISIFLSALTVLFTALPVSALSVPEEREYCEDGSYFVTTVSDNLKNEAELGIFNRILEFFRKIIEFFTGQKSISKTKYLNYYSSDGDLLWTARLKADFTYTKTSSVCTDSEFGIEIFDKDWTLLSAENSEKDNRAEALFSVKQRKLLVPLLTVSKKITLTCDNGGKVY
ncbi:MAG: hypothetical protein E7535_09080 [Ruminococcaceae bacterium]|nr:hypothetical protein [Oscillospiraceae bacterium]